MLAHFSQSLHTPDQTHFAIAVPIDGFWGFPHCFLAERFWFRGILADAEMVPGRQLVFVKKWAQVGTAVPFSAICSEVQQNGPHQMPYKEACCKKVNPPWPAYKRPRQAAALSSSGWFATSGLLTVNQTFTCVTKTACQKSLKKAIAINSLQIPLENTMLESTRRYMYQRESHSLLASGKTPPLSFLFPPVWNVLHFLTTWTVSTCSLGSQDLPASSQEGVGLWHWWLRGPR